MREPIHYCLEEGLALIGLASAPVNALGHDVRVALSEAFKRAAADVRVQAIVLYGTNGVFSAGADIEELGTEALFLEPNLPSALAGLANIHKPVIAAIGKFALGGGLELALACGYRIGEPGTRVGLAEINFGLLPGAGGTQRLPRLIGVESALNFILSGKQIDAKSARLLGLLDRIAPSADELLDEARAYAYELIACCAPARPAEAWPEPTEGLPDDFLARYRAEHEPRWKSRLAPRLVLSALEAACLLPLEEGLARELALFKQAEASRQSKALRHVFVAERESRRFPGLDAGVPLRSIRRVAIIGAGTKAGGIVMSFANAGLPVTLFDLSEEGLDRGLMQIRSNYESSVRHGSLALEKMKRSMDLIVGTLDYADLVNADLVIEALDTLEVKQQVFRNLDEVCKPEAILASSSSSIDVDSIASTLSRPQNLVGLNFFQPTNVMRLLEVVRGRATAADVLATTLDVARRIGKLPVISGASSGFIGNRMLEAYAREAHRLVLEGATPLQVDRVLTELDLNMGVFGMLDLVGIDANHLARNAKRAFNAHDESYCRLGDELFSMGRYGQKTGRGFYLYEGRNPKEDAEVIALAERLADELGIPRRPVDDQEILDRCLFVLINEGIQLLDEGVALRAGDIDLVWINGYGFPAHLGGPMHYAEQLGLDRVLASLRCYRDALGEYGEMWFKPAPLLERLVASGRSRIERSEGPPPPSRIGNSTLRLLHC